MRVQVKDDLGVERRRPASAAGDVYLPHAVEHLVEEGLDRNARPLGLAMDVVQIQEKKAVARLEKGLQEFALHLGVATPEERREVLQPDGGADYVREPPEGPHAGVDCPFRHRHRDRRARQKPVADMNPKCSEIAR